MGVTVKSRSYVLTALNDVIAQPILVDAIIFRGSGMAAADRLTITDNDGSVIFDYTVIAANDDASLNLPQPKWYPGLKLTAVPSGAAFTVTVDIR